VEEKKEEIKKTEIEKDSATAAELAKVRSSNKLYKIATIIFSVLFIVLLCVVLFIYQKLSGFKDLLLPQSETMADSAFSTGDEEGLPKIMPEGLKRFAAPTQTQGGSALTVFTNGGEYAQDGSAITAADGERTARILARYADRKIVKDFMVELKKDPDFARALKEKAANNPLGVIASVRKMKSLQGLTIKFAMRKDFMPLMMEVVNDPDMKPLLSKLPMGGMGPAQLFKMLSGVQSQAAIMEHPEKYAAPATGKGEQDQDNSAMKRRLMRP
jgi:hypothetical protein